MDEGKRKPDKGKGRMESEDMRDSESPFVRGSGHKPDMAFLDDILRKQSEIIHGFPLISLVGHENIVRHLTPLNPETIVNFPAKPPKAGRIKSEEAILEVGGEHKEVEEVYIPDYSISDDEDTMFDEYTREMALLMGSSDKLRDATVDPAEWKRLKSSARKTMMAAMKREEADWSNITFKDPPYGKPSKKKARQPYYPKNLEAIKKADRSAVHSLALRVLDDGEFPYPSPAISTKPAFNRKPVSLDKPTPKWSKTEIQEYKAEKKIATAKSKAFLASYIQDGAEGSGTTGADGPDIRKARSPIPLLHRPSSTATTPRKQKDTHLRPDSVSQVQSSSAPPHANGQTSRLMASKANSHIFPSPITPSTSSPDPLALQGRKSVKPSMLNSAGGSSTGWVVEVPTLHKKRPSELDLRGMSVEKKKRPHSNSVDPHPFTGFTSSEMDVDLPSEDNPNFESSPAPARSSQTIHRPNSHKLNDKSRQASSPSRNAPVKSTAQLEEAAFQELSEYVDDILEADDSATLGYFLPQTGESYTGNGVDALLEPGVMRKLSRLARTLVKTSTGKKIYETSVDIDQMSRLLNILGRSIATGESLNVLPAGLNKASRTSTKKKSPSKSPSKSKKKSSHEDESPRPDSARRRSNRSATPASYCEDDEEEKDGKGSAQDEEDFLDVPSSQSRPKLAKRTSTSSASKGRRNKNAIEEDEDEEGSFTWDKKTLTRLEHNLTALRNAIQAVDTLMTILGSGNLPKQLYSEDLINSGLNMLKQQLSSVIYPCLDPERNPLGSAQLDDKISKLLRKILAGISSSFEGIACVLNLEDASESTVINAVYIAIAPFFSDQGVKSKAKDVSGALEMKVVRNGALAMIRTTFAKYPAQRNWIIEEVLSSITKLPDLAKHKPQYMLHDGQAIQSISALLLHLVQSCTTGLRQYIQAVLKTSKGGADDGDEESTVFADTVAMVQDVVEPALDAARQSCGVIVGYLVKRSGKAPKNATAGEAEYKAVLEHLIRDLLLVVDLPDWPVADLMLQMAIKAMLAVLDDPKVTADVNTAKGIALEHLGTISSKVYKMAESAKKLVESTDQGHGILQPIVPVLRAQDRKAMKRLASAEHAYISQLLDLAADEEDLQSAVDFASARWGGELILALRILQSFEEGYKAKFEKELFMRQDALWRMHVSNTNFQSSDTAYATLQSSLRGLFPVHGLCQSMESLLVHILGACEGAVIAFRQKALKALASIVEQDPSIFLQDNVRQAVEKRLLDSSPAVRDAALEMLGRYVVYRPELAKQYLPRIAERINDSGLSVRKRVIKLLKSLYPVVEDHEDRANICRRIIGRVYDEDDNVKELAATAFEDLFFPTASTPRTVSGPDETQTALSKRREILAKSRVLMAAAAEFRDRPNPLEDILRMIFEKRTGKKSDKGKDNLSGLTKHLKDIVEVLIDSVVDPTYAQDMNLAHCTKTVYILLSPAPTILDVNRATLLLPYLKSATSAEEQTVVEYLTKIFTLILPSLPRSASAFALRLQDSLRGLLNKPAAIGLTALPDVVSCFCSVVVYQTSDYGKLCNVFQTCYVKLQKGVEQLTNEDTPLTADQKALLLRNMPILARLVSLFCQFGQFDKLRDMSPDAAISVNAISQGPIQEKVYMQMIQLYQLSTGTPLHGTALQCLGFLYRAHPTFMLDENSTTIMDKIFLSTSVEAKALLLRNICDFLVSQAQFDHTDEKDVDAEDVDMRLLIGNADNFADSGVSSAIVQRYIHHILEAAITPLSNQALLRPALEAIGFTVKQGLAHPMQCLPVLVALETCPDPAVSAKAFSLHSQLHEKHSALINTRLAESINTVIKYQNRLASGGLVTGHAGEPPCALLSKWYSLMREKRQWRLDFLKAFVRGLHVEPTTSDFNQIQVDTSRFAAENLATFDYKTNEEVFFVVRTLTVMLSLAGMQIYHQMQKEETLDMQVDNEEAQPSVPDALSRKSVVLGFVFVLRQHLKSLYGVTDQKLSKYNTGKKSPAGDKPALIKGGGERTALSYEGIPFALQAIATDDDRVQQCKAYIELIDSDGSIREGEGEEDSDEEEV